MSNLIIRLARSADSLDVLKLAENFATSFTIDPKTFNKSYLGLVGNDSVSLIVAEQKEIVIGYCLAFHHQAFFSNGLVTWVEEITVDEKFRGEHFGTALMQEVERIASSKGSKLVALATRRANEFYKKIGYEDSAIYFRKIL